jgi:hypothetical protein
MLNIITALKKRGLRGDDLLNVLDLIEDIRSVGGIVTDEGIAELYHRTTVERANEIVNDQQMFGKEGGIFFSTHPNGQIVGYGMALLKVLVPIEKLEMDDQFGDEIHLRIEAIPYRKYPFVIKLM